MTTNDAAERLFTLLTERGTGPYADAPLLKSSIRNMLDEALAAERRATVERIRAALDEAMQPFGAIDDAFKPEVFAILDAERFNQEGMKLPPATGSAFDESEAER